MGLRDFAKYQDDINEKQKTNEYELLTQRPR